VRLHAPAAGVGAEPVVLELRAPAVPTPTGCRIDVYVHGTRPGRARLSAGPRACAYLPGQRILARVELRAPPGLRNPGGWDARRAAARRGVHAWGRVVDDAHAPIGGPPAGVAAGLELARRALARSLEGPAQGAPGAQGAVEARAARDARARALLRALVLGDRSRLDPELWDRFARSGTAHLLSVSGLHVAWVLAAGQLAAGALLRRCRSLWWLRRARALALGAGAALAVAYAALTGLEVPALRASAMAFAGAVALASGRAAAGWNALALAGLAALASDPAALFEGGGQLSFAAVAGLLAWQPPRALLRGALHATAAATLATAPLLAWIGGTLPLGTLVANVLAVPFFALLLALGLAGAVVGLLWPAAAAPAISAAALALRGVEWLESPDLLAAAGWPHVFAGALAAAGLGWRVAARGGGRTGRVLAWGAAPIALLALAAPVRNACVAHPRWTFLDVGQGDAVLLQSGCRAWLIDAGDRRGLWDSGRRVVAPALRALGVRRLEALAITHADRDHIGGARAVLERVAVVELWMTRAAARSGAGRALRARAARRGVPVRLLAAGARLAAPGVGIAVVWPPARLDPPSANHGSLVLRIDTRWGCALLSGDAPAVVERALAPDLAPCALLKLGHHGSRTSSDARWLDAVRPAVAVVSAGERSRSPLPHPEVRARVEARGAVLWETRVWGALGVELTPRGVEVQPWVAPGARRSRSSRMRRCSASLKPKRRNSSRPRAYIAAGTSENITRMARRVDSGCSTPGW
jgi:competence protein ComEC